MKKKNNQWLVAAVFLILGFLLTYQYQQRQEPVRTLTIEETELLLQEIAALQGEKDTLLQKNRELLQDVNGETQSSIIVDCKQITFPYTLDVTGAPGVSEGTLYVSEVVDGTIQQLGQYPLTFKKAE